MNSNISENKKIESLQGLRTIAFLMVFLLHTGLSDTGEIGVSIFFVLSGFVYFISYQNRDLDTRPRNLIDFSLGKLKKLYPLHIITMLGFLYFEIKMLVEAFSVKGLVSTIWNTLLNCLLLQVWSPLETTYFSLNAVAWYLAVSMFLYLLFPLILKVIKSYKGPVNAIATIILTLAVMAISSMIVARLNIPQTISNNFIRWFTYVFPVYRLGDFIIGCNMAYLFVSFKPSVNTLVATILELLALGLMLVMFLLRLYGVFVFGSFFMRYNLVYLPATMLLVFVMAMDRGLISRLLGSRPLAYIGALSPYAFLIHSLVIKYVFDFMGNMRISVSPWISTPVIFIITMGLSMLYKTICDKRIKK